MYKFCVLKIKAKLGNSRLGVFTCGRKIIDCTRTSELSLRRLRESKYIFVTEETGQNGGGGVTKVAVEGAKMICLPTRMTCSESIS